MPPDHVAPVRYLFGDRTLIVKKYDSVLNRKGLTMVPRSLYKQEYERNQQSRSSRVNSLPSWLFETNPVNCWNVSHMIADLSSNVSKVAIKTTDE